MVVKKSETYLHKGIRRPRLSTSTLVVSGKAQIFEPAENNHIEVHCGEV